MPLTPDVPPNKPSLPPKPGLPPAARPGAPLPADPPAAPAAPARPADGAALTPGVGDVQARGGKRPLAAYTPAEDDEPAAPGPSGPTFSSKGLRPPAAPCERVEQAAGAFELRVAWGRVGDGVAATGVAVRANAAGDLVTVDGGGGVKLGGEPLAPAPETPHPLAGGGAVTDWGGGYVTVESSQGDSVSVFARGEHVDFLGRLA